MSRIGLIYCGKFSLILSHTYKVSLVVYLVIQLRIKKFVDA